MSSSQYGLLNMILPFVTILSKIFFCSLADRHRAHRSFFICFLIIALIGYGSFAVLPFIIQLKPKAEGLNAPVWAVICIMTSTATIAMSVISCLSDAFAVNSATKRKTNYGFVRLWGTLGWGVSSLSIAYLNQINALPLLVPGLILLIVLIGSDVIIMIAWPNKEDFNLDKLATTEGTESLTSVLQVDQRGQNYGTARLASPEENMNVNSSYSAVTKRRDTSDIAIQWILFKEVATRRRSIFRFMTLFTISGALISIQWSYFFLFLEQIYSADFTYISGLSMVSQAMLGELPFFLISKIVIQTLGRSHTLSLSIMTIGLRYLLYRYLLPNGSMYFVLLTETFQGPNFGLFYVVMTEVGLDYSDCEKAIVSVVNRGLIDNDPEQLQKLRQALRATMQSLMSACYEGLGIGIGSILGGLVIDHYGFDTLWFYAAIIAIVLGAINMLLDTLDVCWRDDKADNSPQICDSHDA